MAELPKDIVLYGGVGLFAYVLLPQAERADVKSRVAIIAVSKNWWRLTTTARAQQQLKGVVLCQHLLPL